MKTDGRIVIRGAGMHPYIWGKVRFSVWAVLVLWFLSAVGLELWLQPLPIFPTMVGICIITSLIYLSGFFLTKHHPYFPEVLSAAAWRFLRRARFLNS